MVCPEPRDEDGLVGILNHEYFDLLNRRLGDLRAPEHASEEPTNLH